MTDRTDGIAKRDWIPGEPAGDGIIETRFAIIGGIIVTAIINAVFLYCCYDFLGKRSIADAYFHGDPPTRLSSFWPSSSFRFLSAS